MSVLHCNIHEIYCGKLFNDGACAADSFTSVFVTPSLHGLRALNFDEVAFRTSDKVIIGVQWFAEIRPLHSAEANPAYVQRGAGLI